MEKDGKGWAREKKKRKIKMCTKGVHDACDDIDI